MAQKPDIAAAKARKQKIILAVAGVALVGLAVIQVPKLMKGGSEPTAAPVAEAPASADPASATTAPVAVAAAASTSKPAGYVAGVALPGGTTVRVASTNKLAAFTLFEVKDPFVQQVDDQTGLAQPDAPAAPAADAAPADGAASADGAAAPAGSGAPAAATPEPVVYATIMFDGKPQQLKVKQKFPTKSPLFVLVSLKKKQAKIGVAGGSFDDGKNVTLALGKKVTLVDTATGVRYELKLVYTGSAPEELEGFSTDKGQGSTTVNASAGTTVDVSASAGTAK
jgi:hypothetical protein